MTSRPAQRRAGRRAGTPRTREAILAAARACFAERGYDGASMRFIAATAGVDAALIHHYFQTKEKLFLAVADAPLDPRPIATEISAIPAGERAAALVRTLLATWESPQGTALFATMRGALGTEANAAILRELLVSRVLRHVAADLPGDDETRRWRAGLVASQIAGLILTRYVLRLEPLASAPPERIVAEIAPTVQRYLTGPMERWDDESAR